MRSIRRSLLGYLLVLLALALGGIGVFVDRFANAAIRAREKAESGRIEQTYDTRRMEAKAQFDAELVTEAKALNAVARSVFYRVPGVGRLFGRPLEPRPKGTDRPPELRLRDPDSPLRVPEKEVEEYRKRAYGLLLGSGAGEWPALASLAAVNRFAAPAWSAYEAPRTVGRLRLPEVFRRILEEDQRPGDEEYARVELPDYYQFQLVVNYPGRPPQTLGVIHSPRVARDLPLDAAALEKPDTEFYHDDVEGGTYRRVVFRGPRHLAWLLPVWPTTPSPGSVLGSPPAPGSPPVRRHWDYQVRVYVHYARPYSDLDARLTSAAEERDEQIQSVRNGTRAELTQLRTRLGLIGGGSFVALVLGGWLIVARGLAPIGKLSAAVSQVSEKDFHLAVEPADLSRELVPIHARLTQTFESLRRAFAREKQAVADISHELRTPIASLLATIDVSLRKQRSPDQYRATLEDCRAIARQLGQLVERIMTLASLDAGTARTAVTPVDTADLVAGCAAVIRPLAEAHGLTFALKGAEPVELATDPDKLREVLMNLLHNAVEYNRPGGKVELGVRRENATVVFEVRDTGIGMTPEVREKIFQRFFRADASRHATGVHAGLGLAIVKEYVDRLGGTIGVDSTPDAGSTFRVTLPASPPAPAAEPDEGSRPPEDARPERRPRGRPARAGS